MQQLGEEGLRVDGAQAAGRDLREQICRSGSAVLEPEEEPEMPAAGDGVAKLRFRENFGLALRALRQSLTFAAPARGPWTMLIAVATSFQSNAKAWPSQQATAADSGYIVRAVRKFIHILERRGFVRWRWQRRPNGSDQLFCAPGKVTLLELAGVAERYPRERPKHVRRELPGATSVAQAVPPPAVPPHRKP